MLREDVDGYVRTLNDTQQDANNKDVDKNPRNLVLTSQRNWELTYDHPHGGSRGTAA
jgi:hypothetical protein